jgi:hypothetical protein
MNMRRVIFFLHDQPSKMKYRNLSAIIPIAANEEKWEKVVAWARGGR